MPVNRQTVRELSRKTLYNMTSSGLVSASDKIKENAEEKM